MKKLILIAVMAGIVSWAQATSITVVPSGSVISGPYSYIYNETVTPLTSGTTLASASLTFNNIELIYPGPSNIPNTLFYDLINQDYASKTISSGETTNDYFQSNAPYKAVSDALGSFTMKLDVTNNWTYTFSGQALTDLLSDFQSGYFDIGLDPNCIYDIGSINFNYTTTTTTGKNVSVPDTAMTAGLLGMTFLVLMSLRRKLAYK